MAVKEKEELGLLFDVPQSGDLPTNITLFEFGTTDTVKGPFLMDEMAADMVMRQFREHGSDRLPFDVGHGMLKPGSSPDAHKAYGWFVPSIEDLPTGGRGLVASDIQWTKAGAEALSNREFRFFSPGILFESESRRITKLINVALTNLPATKNQTPLVLDALGAETDNTKENQEMKALLDVLGVSDEASAVAKVGEFKGVQSDVQALLSAVEADSASGAIEAINKLKDVAQAGVQAQAELSALTVEVAKEKRAGAIEKLCDEGKLLDSQKEFAALLSDDQFEQFSKTLVASPVLTGKKIEEANLSSDEGDGRVEGATFRYEDEIEGNF